MTTKTHPLELIIRVNGDVELLNAASETVWTSDGDEDFWEFIDTDLCEESDVDEILGYLEDTEELTAQELEEFENGGFDINIEESDDSVVDTQESNEHHTRQDPDEDEDDEADDILES